MSVIIIGAGPAGIQTAYFLEKFKIKYIVLEKENSCGNMVNKKKIINSQTINTESLNEDNYSLLSDDSDTFNFKNYIKQNTEIIDLNKLYVRYLNEFKNKYNLNVEFNIRVMKISLDKDKNIFTILTNKRIIKAIRIIVAIGKNRIEIPKNLSYTGKKKIEHILNVLEEDLQKIKDKNILICENYNNVQNKINILTKNSNRTIILKFNNYLEYNLIENSQTMICKTSDIRIINDEEKFYIQKNDCITKICDIEFFDHVYLNSKLLFDKVIFDDCIQLKSDSNDIPYINKKGLSTENKNLIFVGSLLDFEISTYRYIIKNLFKEWFFIDVNNDYSFEISSLTTTHTANQKNKFIEIIEKRLIEFNDLWYSNSLIGDLFYIDHLSQTIKYHKNFIITDIITNFTDAEELFIISIDKEEKNSIRFVLKIYKKNKNYFIFDKNFVFYENSIRYFDNIKENIKLMLNILF